MTARVRWADEAVRTAVGRVEDGVGRVVALTRYGWPVMAGWRAVSAAVTMFVRGNQPARGTRAASLPPHVPQWRTH